MFSVQVPAHSTAHIQLLAVTLVRLPVLPPSGYTGVDSITVSSRLCRIHDIKHSAHCLLDRLIASA
jgi:hypothetical protein